MRHTVVRKPSHHPDMLKRLKTMKTYDLDAEPMMIFRSKQQAIKKNSQLISTNKLIVRTYSNALASVLRESFKSELLRN